MKINQNMPTIPANEYQKRWEHVQQMMVEQNLDLILAYADDRATFGPAHARWLANFPVHFEPTCILIPRKGDLVMLCGPESDEYARLSGMIKDVRVLKEFTHPDEDYPYASIHSLSDIIANLGYDLQNINRVGIAGLGLMGNEVAAAIRASLNAQWIDVENAICSLRAVKSEPEIEVIRYAYKLAEAGIQAAVDAVRPGVTEREVAAEAEAVMRRGGAEGTGIDTIVASGPNSRPILARSTFRHIQENDFVLLTVAPRYEGYHGAIGRLVLVGEPGQEIVQAYETACKAQEACFQLMRPGVAGSLVEAAGRQIVKEAGLGDYFLYSGVHSVGVIEFEPPIFGPSSETRFRKDMVISVDIPMFNAPWGGLRVEDGFIITATGAERLNHTSKMIRK